MSSRAADPSAASVRRRGGRGGPDLEGGRQAGQADVASHGRLPAGPHPPDGHLAGPGHGGHGASSASSSGTSAFRPTSATVWSTPSVRRRTECQARSESDQPDDLPAHPGDAYNFGAVSHDLNETEGRFNTGSMRNIYSPDVRTARSWWSTSSPRRCRKDPYQFRRRFLRDERLLAVLDKVAEVGDWGQAMPAGTAQGIAHPQGVQGRRPCLVEIDCRPATVNRQVRDGGHRAARHQGDLRRRRRPASINPRGPRGPDDGRHHRRASRWR